MAQETIEQEPEIDMQAVVAELQQQMGILSTRAAQYHGMLVAAVKRETALREQIAGAQKPPLAAV